MSQAGTGWALEGDHKCSNIQAGRERVGAYVVRRLPAAPDSAAFRGLAHTGHGVTLGPAPTSSQQRCCPLSEFGHVLDVLMG